MVKKKGGVEYNLKKQIDRKCAPFDILTTHYLESKGKTRCKMKAGHKRILFVIG